MVNITSTSIGMADGMWCVPTKRRAAQIQKVLYGLMTSIYVSCFQPNITQNVATTMPYSYLPAYPFLLMCVLMDALYFHDTANFSQNY